MRKIILTILLVVSLVGCSSAKPPMPPVDVPVWTPPTITMPKRPVLTSTNIGTDGDIARKIEDDLIIITEYAKELENLLIDIQNSHINK